jgi:hypothetical protein
VKLRRADFPTVIANLVDAYRAATKDLGVSGRASVHREERDGATEYVIVVRVPAAETAMSRAMAPPKSTK